MKRIAIIGLGTVGSGVYQKLTDGSNKSFQLVNVVVKEPQKERAIKGYGHLLSSIEEVINDNSIDVIIELINDEQAALDIAIKTLETGKVLISGNKKMLARNIEVLNQLAEKHQTQLFYEAAVCGSIPIILLLKQYYSGNRPQRIRTIANGTSNFILSTLWKSEKTFNEILIAAQNAGFAESDPTDDIGGYDVQSKLALIILNAFDTAVDVQSIPCFGIQNIKMESVNFFKGKGLKVKLIGEASLENRQLISAVIPNIIAPDDSLFNIEEEQNVVEIENQLSAIQLYQGKGAGGFPTTQAVLADLQAINSRRINCLHRSDKITQNDNNEYLFYVYKQLDNTINRQKLAYSCDKHLVVKATFEQIKSLYTSNNDLFVAKISQNVFDKYLS